MSKAKHKGYRKVLSIENTTYQDLKVKLVFWCIQNSVTSRTVRTNHLAVSVYINNKLNLFGVDARFFDKIISIQLKEFKKSKSLSKIDFKRLTSEAFTSAYNKYLQSLGEVTGTVSWFNRDSGMGSIKCDETQTLTPVYACNILGKKTWYPETACIYLEKGQQVTFKHSEACGAVDVSGGILDLEKWNKLDHNKLAFKCDDQGLAINGLFE